MKNLVWLVIPLLFACASPSLSSSFDQIHVGMDKDKVLEKLGNPKRTFREASQDHWTYIYFHNDREWRRDVIFEDGKVLKVTKPTVKEEWVKDLEKSKTMEEYEQKAREHQKKANNFKSIDGSVTEPAGN